MLLVIDAGNTNIVFALYDGETQRAVHRLETATVQAEEGISLPSDFVAIDGVIIASVVPACDPILHRFCVGVLEHEPLFVTHETVPLESALDHPEQAGADRLVNAYAAALDIKGAAVVVDFGTATTFDVVDKNGVFRGGVIAPGVNLSKEALVRAAAKLPDVPVEKPVHVIGTNTVEAMKAGLYWGYASMIEGMLARIADELGEMPRVMATGGLADLFAPAIPAIEKVDKDLTLKGLVRLYEEVTS